MTNILRVHLNESDYEIGSTPMQYSNLGGRALTSSIISQEVPPECDSLREQNKLVFAPGILADSGVPNSGRLSIGGKSPLTNLIKESNAGGSASQKLARLGIQALVLEGIANEWKILKINKDGLEFFSAREIKGKGLKAATQHLRKIHGEGVCVIGIGPAGELGFTAAAIAVTSPDNYPRMAARGGLGAVMGAKRVKAIVIDDEGTSQVEVKDPELFKSSVNAYTKGLMSHPLIGGLKAFGTPLLVNMINEMGAISTKNYSQGQFPGAEKISGEYIAGLLNSRPNGKNSHKCMNGCVISCSNIYTDADGKEVVAGLEYETLALMGANCMIDDVDTIAAMNAVCNDYGLDTVEVGGAIAVAMEAGILEWGDGKKALEYILEIPMKTKVAEMFGHGTKYTGKKLGAKRIPVVKGQCMAGYDPRVLKGTGTTYATSPMGADHTCGNALPSPANPDYNPSASSGQAPVSQFLQRYFAAVDSLGMCLFATLPALDMPELQKNLIDCVSIVIDESLDDHYLMLLGEMVLTEERKFNRAAGITIEDDRLPSFFKVEPLSPSNNLFDISDDELDMVHQ